MKDNSFKWSLDRQSMYMNCPRAYYHARISTDDMLSRQLASICNLEQWCISVIRDTIKACLLEWAASGNAPSEVTLKEKALDIMRKTWLSCLEEKWKKYPEDSTNIFELYYGNGRDYATLRRLPKETTDAAKDRIMDAMDTFAQSRFFAGLTATNKNEWHFPDRDRGFPLEETTVCETPDFVFRDNEDKICTVAWIFGNEYRPHLRIRQACFKMYAMAKLSAHGDNVRVITVLFNDGGRMRDCITTPGDMASVKAQIKKGAEAIKNRVNESVQIEDYPQRPSESCQFCNFKRICMEQ